MEPKMRIPTPNQWRYQKLAQVVAEKIRSDAELSGIPHALEDIILHAFDQVYAMGQDDPVVSDQAIPVADLSDMPGIVGRAGRKEGQCD